MIQVPKVLFICSGNIFRSMTAEYAFKAVLDLEDRGCVSSAGLRAAPHEIVPFVSSHLNEMGFDISRHKPRTVDRAMLRSCDLAIAMGFEHRDRIREIFGLDLPLFSEVAYGTQEPLLDVHEVVDDWRNNETEAAAYGRFVMDYIIDGMSGFQDRVRRFAGTVPE